MSQIRSKDTAPEKQVKRILRRFKINYRSHPQNIPGKPDIVLPRFNTVVFVHGCFWHQHKNCHRANIPKSNIAYWKVKLLNNVKRDRKYSFLLKKEGWKILIVWECEIGHNTLLKKLSHLEKQYG
ncbi:MAG: DNA mismatch endonuclease Vsr [Candidatus Omnitrophica bacterium]|nr:DNA mismatch endonuclease Vsr [Candidatus Omnitrophota bacterium]